MQNIFNETKSILWNEKLYYFVYVSTIIYVVEVNIQ